MMRCFTCERPMWEQLRLGGGYDFLCMKCDIK